MANLIITTKNHEGVRGANYRSINAKLDGKDVLNTLVGGSVYDFTNEAIGLVVGQVIAEGFTPISLTVSVTGISTEGKTQLVNAYSGDTLLTSITFE